MQNIIRELSSFPVIANESHYETNQCNLTCELMGFTHNLPEVRVYWELSTGGLVDTSLPGLKIGISSEKHFTWIDINLISENVFFFTACFYPPIKQCKTLALNKGRDLVLVIELFI